MTKKYRPQTILQHPTLAARRQRDAAAVGVGGVDGGGEGAELDRRVNRRRRETRVLVQLGTLDSALVGGQRRLRRHPQARFAGLPLPGKQCALGERTCLQNCERGSGEEMRRK